MGTYKTNWQLTETVMPEDFNRIEENIKENNKNHNDFKNEYDKTLKEQNKKIDAKSEKSDVVLKIPQRLPATTDLNTVVKGGNYIVVENTPNSPVSYGRLVVYQWDASAKWITQVLYSDMRNEVYTRCSTNAEATSWTPWKKLISTSETDNKYLNKNLGNVSDFNLCKTEGIYNVQAENIPNAPFKSSTKIYGKLIVYVRDRDITHMFISHENRIFLRFCNNGELWGNWTKVFSTFDTPSWGDVKGKPEIYTKAESDARYLNKRVGRVTDFNTCTSPGIYIVSSGTAIPNSPISSGIYGTLLVQPREDELSQLLVTSTGRIFTRYQGYNKAWTNWTRVYSTSDKPTWDEVINKPSTFSPSTHNHDTLYARVDRGTVTDFNQCKNIGTYNISGKDIPNAPFKGNIYGTLEVLPRGADKVQRVITSSGASYVRFYAEGGVNTGFREWVKVYTSTNKPSWNDIEAKPSTFTPATHNHDDSYLKKSNGFVSDFNKCLTEGIYSVGSDNAIPNGPVNGGIYGVLEVFKKKNEYLQRCTNFNGQTYVRYLNYKNEWLPWNRIISNNDFITGTVDGKYYMKLPNNMLIQWGHVIVTIAEGFNNASSLVYFPVSFASDYMCTGNVAANDFGGYAEVNASVIQENPTRAFTQVFTLNGRAPGGGKKVRVNWMAIGRY